MSTTAWIAHVNLDSRLANKILGVPYELMRREGVDLMAGWVGVLLVSITPKQARRFVAFAAAADDSDDSDDSDDGDDDCDVAGRDDEI